MRIPLVVCGALLFCSAVNADPVLHKFDVWGKMRSQTDKLVLYMGWTNGFIPARGSSVLGLLNCLSALSPEQAVGMIDKYYKDHPEKWSGTFTDQVLAALTVPGGSCAGQNPLTKGPK